MSSTYTLSNTATFTITDAKYLASKVATDLMRVHRLYAGRPSASMITDYQTELMWLLKYGCLQHVTYGFKRNGKWTEPTLQYTARELVSSSANDDDPGRVRPGPNVDGLTFSSFLEYSSRWSQLSQAERATLETLIPIKRSTGTEPGYSGYFVNDLTYTSSGRSLSRSTLRS